MRDDDYLREQGLRALTHAKGAREAADVLADFYEQCGQPSRAKLWRDMRIRPRKRNPADLINQDPKWRRKVMIWLLGHVAPRSTVARAFRSSPEMVRIRSREVEQRICEVANAERHHPTMAATLRLQAAGALLAPFEQRAFELGTPPPESWPVTQREGGRGAKP